MLVGYYAGATSNARIDSELVEIEATLGTGRNVFELRKDFEYALIVLEGAVSFNSQLITPGNLAYFGKARYELPLTAQEPCTLLLLGGTPFSNAPFMWWNFVARNPDEITQAYTDWQSHSVRFGHLRSKLNRIEVPKPQWLN